MSRFATVVFLDDDPTGTQTVAGIPVITRWEPEDVAWAFDQRAPGFFVLTNTRSLGPAEMAARNRAVVAAVAQAAGGRDFVVASRGDSTLRGHVPAEPDAIAAQLEASGWGRPGAVLLVPAFPAAGRITVDGVHLLRDGDGYLPVGSTPYAADATFGFRSSFLPDWLAEKSGGRIAAGEVEVVTVQQLRSAADAVVGRLVAAEPGRYVVADAETDEDLRLLSRVVVAAEAAGARLIYRCSPGFVLPRLGLAARPPLTAADLGDLAAPWRRVCGEHGLVVVGSHVPQSTRQLGVLVASGRVLPVEIDVDRLLEADGPAGYRAQVASAVVDALGRGDVVLSTSRVRRDGVSGEDSLRIAREVSEALVAVTRTAFEAYRPAFVVAKGGITSSDIGTGALGLRRAVVMGSLDPGIVWREADDGGRSLPFVLVPGNIGGDDALLQVVALMRSSLGRSG